MKISLLSIIISVLSLGCFAQVQNPVTWTFSSKKLSGNQYELKMTATLTKGWHIYSQNTPEGGPEPTKFTFTPDALVTNTGRPKEVGKLEKSHDANFGIDVLNFSNKVEFVQKVTVKNAIKTNVSGKVYYMVCDDSKCLPPKEVGFSIALK